MLFKSEETCIYCRESEHARQVQRLNEAFERAVQANGNKAAEIKQLSTQLFYKNLHCSCMAHPPSPHQVSLSGSNAPVFFMSHVVTVSIASLSIFRWCFKFV